MFSVISTNSGDFFPHSLPPHSLFYTFANHNIIANHEKQEIGVDISAKKIMKIT